MRFRVRLFFIAICIVVLIYLFYVFFVDNTENSENSVSNDLDQPKKENIVYDDSAGSSENDGTVNYNVHTFYYPWYGNPQFDNGSYYHWNHNILPGAGTERLKKKRYQPPDDIGADFYPKLGPYSSRDPAVLSQHFQWIRQAGIGTVVVSWYPPGHQTDQGHSWDDLIPAILDAAHEERLKIAFHIEPYKGRDVDGLLKNLEYILSSYGSHPAFYRYHRRRSGTDEAKAKPLFYIYDSYLIKDVDWRTVLRRDGKRTVRNTLLDSYFIGLLVADHEKTTLPSAGFDGYYTYFAANGFSYGSSWKNWRAIGLSARRMNMIFIPCVGPGYIDQSVRPWNKENIHPRGEHGEYYSESWKSAIDARPPLIGVTSFNEWHEGTQIEPAVAYSAVSRTYLNYEPMESTAYLKITRDWVIKFTDHKL